MTTYRMRKVVYEPVDIPDNEVMTIVQASRVLGITINGVKQHMKNGVLSWLELDSDKQGRHRVLRREVEALQRKQRAK